MNPFINKPGLLSIILVLLTGTLTGYAAPLAEGEGIATNHTSHGALDACRDVGTPTNSNKMVSWQEMCRPTLLINDHLRSSLPSFHRDLLVGDMSQNAQVNSFSSVHCFAESRTGTSAPGNNCISIGLPGVISLAGTPMISDTFQSLYVFELPEFEFQGRESSEVVLPYKRRTHSRYSENIVADQNVYSLDGDVAPNIQLLALQREEFRKLVFWDYDYQIEVSNTLTRFIPKNLSTRNLDVGDLIAVLLLALLLPDYRKLRLFWGSVFVRRTLKC